MKIVITNTVTVNTGDAAILLATIEILRRSYDTPIEFTVFDSQASVSSRYYPEIDFRQNLYSELAGKYGTRLGRYYGLLVLLSRILSLRLFPRDKRRARVYNKVLSVLNTYSSADVVVSAGGTYLRAGYQLWPKELDFLVALALGKPLVLFTQSIGPLSRARDRALLGFIFRRCRLILVRDEESRRTLRQMGLGAERVALAADGAFALAGPYGAKPPRPPQARALRIAVSVRDWPHFETRSGESGMEAYLDSIAGLVHYLVREYAATVAFVSTCQGVKEYWTDDSLIAERVRDRLPPAIRPFVSIDHDFHRPEQLIRSLAQHDLVVATRFHVAILALCSAIPVLPIVYEFKTSELFRRIDRNYPLPHIETVTADALVHAFQAIHTRYDELRSVIEEWVAIERERALNAGRIVSNAIPANA